MTTEADDSVTELASSLERIVPDHIEEDSATGLQTLQLHQARYIFAAQHIQEGRILDMASGTGYGSEILLRESQSEINQIVGVDISPEAIAYANKRYAHPKVNFLNQDIDTFNDQAGFQNIVSLETIEHLPEPQNFVIKLVKLLQPGGVLICSAPTTPSVDVNPYHLNDFTEHSFRKMFLSQGLVEIDSLSQVQTYSLGAVRNKTETRMKDLRSNLLGYYITHPHKAFKRLWATARYGFTNRYLTVVCQKPQSP